MLCNHDLQQHGFDAGRRASIRSVRATQVGTCASQLFRAIIRISRLIFLPAHMQGIRRGSRSDLTAAGAAIAWLGVSYWPGMCRSPSRLTDRDGVGEGRGRNIGGSVRHEGCLGCLVGTAEKTADALLPILGEMAATDGMEEEILGRERQSRYGQGYRIACCMNCCWVLGGGILSP